MLLLCSTKKSKYKNSNVTVSRDGGAKIIQTRIQGASLQFRRNGVTGKRCRVYLVYHSYTTTTCLLFALPSLLTISFEMILKYKSALFLAVGAILVQYRESWYSNSSTNTGVAISNLPV